MYIRSNKLKINDWRENSGKYGVVFTTFEDEQQAKDVIDEIIRCKLAACAQEIKIKAIIHGRAIFAMKMKF